MCCTSRVCCFRWFLFILSCSPFYPLPFNFFICLSFSLFLERKRTNMYEHTNVWLYLLLYSVLFAHITGETEKGKIVDTLCAQFPLDWAYSVHHIQSSLFLIATKFRKYSTWSRERKKSVHFYLSPSSHWFENRLYCILIALTACPSALEWCGETFEWYILIETSIHIFQYIFCCCYQIVCMSKARTWVDRLARKWLTNRPGNHQPHKFSSFPHKLIWWKLFSFFFCNIYFFNYNNSENVEWKRERQINANNKNR